MARRADLHADRLALKVLHALDGAGFGLRGDEGEAGSVERVGIEDALLALLGDGEACGAHLDGAREHGGDDGVEAEDLEFDFGAEFLADGPHEVHFEAGDFSRLGVDEFKGGERRFRGHLDEAFRKRVGGHAAENGGAHDDAGERLDAGTCELELHL